MPHYDPSLTLREARAQYFADNEFGADGGYAERWIRLQVGPLPIYIYNSQMRVRAVRYHDIHHVLTGHDTTWIGEAEIGAWEVASGCAHHLAAWGLNLAAMWIGTFLAPRAVWRACYGGRRSGNLYRARFDDALLDTRVGDMQTRLGLDTASESRRSANDLVTFVLWWLVAFMLLPGCRSGG